MRAVEADPPVGAAHPCTRGGIAAEFDLLEVHRGGGDVGLPAAVGDRDVQVASGPGAAGAGDGGGEDPDSGEGEPAPRSRSEAEGPPESSCPVSLSHCAPRGLWRRAPCGGVHGGCGPYPGSIHRNHAAIGRIRRNAQFAEPPFRPFPQVSVPGVQIAVLPRRSVPHAMCPPRPSIRDRRPPLPRPERAGVEEAWMLRAQPRMRRWHRTSSATRKSCDVRSRASTDVVCGRASRSSDAAHAISRPGSAARSRVHAVRTPQRSRVESHSEP
jgi:hypothetical protein